MDEHEEDVVPISPGEFETALSVEHRNTGILLGFSITALALILFFMYDYRFPVFEIATVTLALASSTSFFVYSLRTRVLALYLTHYEAITGDKAFFKDIWRYSLHADASSEVGLAFVLLSIFLFLMFIELVAPAVTMMLIVNLLFSRWSFQKMSRRVKKKFGARPHTRALISRFRDFTRLVVLVTRGWIPIFMTAYYILAEYLVIVPPDNPYWIILFLIGFGLSVTYILKTEEEISII
ncbi:MAG: hypothetical protein ACTSV0_10730 [Candidatus Freyarchaeota archaeon]